MSDKTPPTEGNKKYHCSNCGEELGEGMVTDFCGHHNPTKINREGTDTTSLSKILSKYFMMSDGYADKCIAELLTWAARERIDELENLPWKRADKYGINSPYVTKAWLVKRKAELTNTLEGRKDR